MIKPTNSKIGVFFTSVLISVLAFMLPTPILMAGTLPVFPGAKGFGTETRAAYSKGNNPIICIVNTLSHTSTSLSNSIRNGVAVKTGSLRACIDYTPPANTGKIILFEVSGTINATSSPYEYKIVNPYTIIAGQTAPSPGITLRNITLRIKTHDVLIQHLRVRVGDAVVGLNPDIRDCLGFTAGDGNTIQNVVVDHCSFSWAIDENIEIYNNSATGIVSDVTLSNCIVSEGLKNSFHTGGAHSKGIQISGIAPASPPNNIALLNNIIALCTDRTPKIAHATNVVVANNIFYNNEWFNVFWGPHYQESNINITNNAGIGGPSSGSHVRNEIITLWEAYDGGNGSKVYLTGNRTGEYSGGKLKWNTIQSVSSDYSSVDNRYNLDTSLFKETTPPVTIPGATYIDSADLLTILPNSVGARPADRDSVDIRIISNFENGTGQIINSPSEVGGWPNLAENNRTLAIPSNPHADDDNDGYTTLEEWLHGFAALVEGKRMASPVGLTIIISVIGQNFVAIV